MTSPQKEENAKPAVKLLKKTCKRVAEVEVNVQLFTKMTKESVATNDVRSMVYKQAKQCNAKSKLDERLIKYLMKRKLNDVCSQLNNLKQKRTRIRREMLKLKGGKQII